MTPTHPVGDSTISKSLDNTREEFKTSDKDSKADLSFADVMLKGGNSALPTKLEQMQATQNLVDKKILAPIILVKDTGKGNPLRNKVKKKKRLMTELAKFDEEILNKIPPEKLAQLLDSQPDDVEDHIIAASLKSELKELVASVLEKMHHHDQAQYQKEIVPQNVAAVLANTNLPTATPSQSQVAQR